MHKTVKRVEMVRTHLRVLLVEDEPSHALLVERALDDADLTDFELEHVDRLSAALETLKSTDFDVTLLDWGLPDGRPLEALSAVCKQRPEIPVVVLTAIDDESAAVEAITWGAQDCLHKGQLSSHSLERVLRYAVQRHQMLAELQDANELLDQKNKRLAELCETAHQFVDNVSHEFRTPLTVIKEFVTIVRDGLAGQVTTQQREYLEIVNDRADDLAIMVDDMLDVSKLEAGLLRMWRRESRVGEVIEHVRPALERKSAIKHVTFEIATADDLPVVYCDPDKIGRVIINLVTNAIKFCGEEGRVRLWARAGDDPTEVAIGVTDDGPGIAPEHVQVIFDRFQQVDGMTQSSTKGFGLGLSIAKELVSLNLGEIRLSSRPGEGSTFWFSVPVWDPSSLLARYLQRLRQADGRAGFASLVVATVGGPVDPGLSNVVDEFFQHVFRGNDLVIRVLPHKWLVVADCHQHELDHLLSRVRAAWTEANRNRPARGLPEIKLHAKGTWPLRTQADRVTEGFCSELPSTADESPTQSVLVVDDDRDTLRGLTIRLTAAGYQVFTASDGREAIDSAAEHQPDVILMDKFMPVMDGVTALGRLMEDPATKNIPVIMLSASLRDQQKTLEQGARFFLQKPCSANTVIAALRKVVEQSPCHAS